MEIKDVAISDLKFAEYNPRKSNQKEKAELKKSLERFDFVEPVVANSAPERKNIIIGGHFRVRMAKEMGKKTVPVHFINLPDIEKEKELNLRLNKNVGSWDEELLADFERDFLEDIGFNSDELDEMYQNVETGDDDEQAEKDNAVPEISDKTGIQIGDIFDLGGHRVMCGDSTNPEHTKALMQDVKADIVFTDPPYNVNYKGRGENTSEHIKNDNMADKNFVEFLDKVFLNYKNSVKPSCPLYVFHASSSQACFEKALATHGFEIKNQLIWNKPNAAMGWGDYRWKHEPFFYAGVKGAKTQFFGNRKNTTVWDMSRDRVDEYTHPTQKPVELITHALKNSSKSDEIVLDLFLGSGSTLIASDKLDRVCYGMELDPKYMQVIIKRWEDYTGKKSVKIPK